MGQKGCKSLWGVLVYITDVDDLGGGGADGEKQNVLEVKLKGLADGWAVRGGENNSSLL